MLAAFAFSTYFAAIVLASPTIAQQTVLQVSSKSACANGLGPDALDTLPGAFTLSAVWPNSTLPGADADFVPLTLAPVSGGPGEEFAVSWLAVRTAFQLHLAQELLYLHFPWILHPFHSIFALVS
jgi:hypothetical protein